MPINKPFRFFDRLTREIIPGVTVVTYNNEGYEVDRGISNSKGVAHTTSESDHKVVFSYPGKKTIHQRYGSAATKQYMDDDPNYVDLPEETTSEPTDSADTTNTVNTMKKNFIVVDDLGKPISGVHVYTSQTNGTITDTNGKATITVKPEDSIIFSHISFEAQQHQVENVPGTIVLGTNINNMDEVVVTAPKKKTSWWKPAGVGLALMLLITAGNKPKKIKL